MMQLRDMRVFDVRRNRMRATVTDETVERLENAYRAIASRLHG